MTFTDGVILVIVELLLGFVIYFNMIKKPVGSCASCAKKNRFSQKSLHAYYQKHK